MARDRPRMKYQTRPPMIASPMMIHSQGVPPSVVAGAAGEPGAAGGVAWAKASFTATSGRDREDAWSLSSMMFPFRPQGLRINVGRTAAFLSSQEAGAPLPRVPPGAEVQNGEPTRRAPVYPRLREKQPWATQPTLRAFRHTMIRQMPVLDDASRGGARTVAEEIIPLVEETATVDKRQVITGRVRVQTVTDTVEEFARADVQRETVEVTRVPIDKVVETAPEIKDSGRRDDRPGARGGARGREAPGAQGGAAHPAPRRDGDRRGAGVTLHKQRAIVERTDLDDPVPEGPAT